MAEFSFCWTGGSEGQSEKQKGVFEIYRGPWHRVIKSLFGQIPGEKAAALGGGSQTKAMRRNLCASGGTEVTSPELQILHRPWGLADMGSSSSCWFKSLSVRYSLDLGVGEEHSTQEVQGVEGRMINYVIKACVCHYNLKMW